MVGGYGKESKKGRIVLVRWVLSLKRRSNKEVWLM